MNFKLQYELRKSYSHTLSLFQIHNPVALNSIMLRQNLGMKSYTPKIQTNEKYLFYLHKKISVNVPGLHYFRHHKIITIIIQL